ncbi:hypothetical protein KBY82_13775 [Cyanobium sp. AMD-g]|uniref:hypothetical protein n=1 Tax=Cyanobium sp. AMD-g TaxID=2823699 RepID=UPI0020CFDD9C|nr:hypothetical protein [Cyanobium sp. AMD-g]MCP9931848.1 hypothetical protein [Cyanobium sp. AMD-g]
MAWIRTCQSLISFGFGLNSVLAAIRSQDDALGDAGLGTPGVDGIHAERHGGDGIGLSAATAAPSWTASNARSPRPRP